MSDLEHKPYPEVMERVGELADALLNNPDPRVAERAEEMLDWIDIFHRKGLEQLVGLIISWRGELFLETVSNDEIAGVFLATYDLTADVLDTASIQGSGR